MSHYVTPLIFELLGAHEFNVDVVVSWFLIGVDRCRCIRENKGMNVPTVRGLFDGILSQLLKLIYEE